MGKLHGVIVSVLVMLAAIAYAVLVLTADLATLILVVRLSLAAAALVLGTLIAWLAYSLLGFTPVEEIERIEREIARKYGIVGEESSSQPRR